jgi:hypothetical protein
MKGLPVLILILFLSPGCRKSSEQIVWEKNYGTGNAISIKATADSGIISCGESGGKPYLIKLDKNKEKLSDYLVGDDGIFSSVWFDSDFIIAAGSSNGKMLIACLNSQNSLLWDTTFSSSFNIDYSSVCYLGNGEFVAVGSASRESINSLVTGLYCVWFNTAGAISNKKEIKEFSSMSANKVINDISGNIYIALTRQSAGSVPRAAVAKYNRLFQKIWETELYNNPNFGASSLGIALDNSGFIYVSGKTQLSSGSGSVDNSFCVKLENNGIIKWKKYLESTNSAASILIDESGQLLILNRNCFRINILNTTDGTETGVIRTFNTCDPVTTDAFGEEFDISYDGNLILSGSKDHGFYLVMKSSLLVDSPQ